MAKTSNRRLQEGALSALKTPKNPPAVTKLVPLRPPPAKNGAGK